MPVPTYELPVVDGEVVDVFGEELPECHPGRYELAQLPEAPFLWYRLRPDRAWGTPALLTAIEQAATRVATLYPTAPPLLVGDLSSRSGGPLPPHRWHFDGRSADIGLFGDIDPVYAWGAGFPLMPTRRLDLPMTWALVESLLETGAVEHILLGQRHIDALRTWVVETGRRTADEAAEIFPEQGFLGGVVRSAPHHDDHLHVRVGCH